MTRAAEQPMRLWVIPGIYPYPAQSERWKGIFIHRQVRAMRQLGLDVRVVQTRDWYPPWPLWTLDAGWSRARAEWRPRQRVIDGVPVLHPVVFSPRPSRLFPRPHPERVIARLVRFLRSQRACPERDVLLCHWLIPDGYIGTRAAQETGLPVGVVLWGDDVALWPFQSPIHREQARWVLEHASALIACSNDLGRRTAALSPATRPLHTIYTSIDVDVFTPAATAADKASARHDLKLASGDLVLLSVGTAVQRKGWIDVLDAMRTLIGEFPRLKLVAVCGGEPDIDLKGEAAVRGLANCCLELGEVAPDKLPRVFQAADVFVLPSHREGLSNAVLEGMAAGLPVVTTPVGGHPEIIQSGVTGEFVPVGDAEALARTLRSLLAQPQTWFDYGARARAAAERVASPGRNAARLLDLLESIRPSNHAVPPIDARGYRSHSTEGTRAVADASHSTPLSSTSH